MLVLMRRLGESLVIGDAIRVHVLSLDEHRCKLGVEAPRDIAVHRHEVWEAIQRSGASGSQPASAETCPQSAVRALRAYLDNHSDPGPFLRAVLANDLSGAMLHREGGESMRDLDSIVRWLFIHATPGCWRDWPAVNEWLGSKR